MRNYAFYISTALTIAILLGSNRSFSQQIAIKSNALFYLSNTPNIGVEISNDDKSTISVGYYHKFLEQENIGRFRYYLLESEYKKWLCKKFVGGYWGIHSFFSEYNIGGISAFNFEKYRYQGNVFGLGFSLGYDFILSSRFNLDFGLGFGYAHFTYEKFNCEHCGDLIKEEVLDYIGPTKASVSLVYLIK